MKNQAYTVNDGEERADVFFADNEADAKQQAANTFSLDIEELGECHRSEDLDQYAESGLPDALTMVLKHGWWYDCYGCSTTINDYNGDFEGVIMQDGHLYCSAQCLAKEQAKQAQNNVLKAEIKTELLAKWAGLKVEWFNLAEQGVFFRWPGGTAGAYWKRGRNTVSLQPEYAEEWMAYKASLISA